MLRVAQISFYLDPQGRAPGELLRAWPTVVDVAECAAGAGVQVSVVQASPHEARLQQGGVSYYFLPCARIDLSASRRARFAALLRELAPDVLHVQGLGFPQEVRALAALAPALPIVLQDHAASVPRFWRRGALRRSTAVVSGVAFCARAQAQPFAQAGILPPALTIYEIPESSSRFTPGDRAAARAATALAGEPQLLWMGHLDANKDPLTVLAGVSEAARALPGLRLACCYLAAPLLAEVRQRIAQDPHLRDRVQLLGRVPHERVEVLMRAADIFVQGSHREGSGYSLIEALACGVAPVVTDIPSFRSLTGGGRIGRLWPCDDAARLSAALREVAANCNAEVRAAVRAHFDAQLSFAAVGEKLAAMYRDLVQTAGIAGAASATRRGT